MEAPLWILVADSSRARIFSMTDPDEMWTFVEEHDRPKARLRASELHSDRGGRTAARSSGMPAAMEPHTDPTEVEAEKFARDLSDVLEHARTQHAWKRLVIAAPPKFLGMLRNALDEDTEKLVEKSFAKELTTLSEHDLYDRMQELLGYNH